MACVVRFSSQADCGMAQVAGSSVTATSSVISNSRESHLIFHALCPDLLSQRRVAMADQAVHSWCDATDLSGYDAAISFCWDGVSASLVDLMWALSGS
eukprot:5520954-Amphidinium_carterae.1